MTFVRYNIGAGLRNVTQYIEGIPNFGENFGYTEYDSTISAYSAKLSEMEGTSYKKSLQKEDEFLKRRTFTVLTKHNIVFKMFIETYIYRRSILMGKNVTYLHLFLRRYDPITDVDITLDSDVLYSGGLATYEYNVDVAQFLADSGSGKHVVISTSERGFLQNEADSNHLTTYSLLESYDPQTGVGSVHKYHNVEIEKFTGNLNPEETMDKRVTYIKKYKANDTLLLENRIRVIHRGIMSMTRYYFDSKTLFMRLDRLDPLYFLYKLIDANPRENISRVIF